MQKLEWLEDHMIHGFAYHSHATFLLVSMDQGPLLAARQILEEFNFPQGRMIPWQLGGIV